MVHRTDIQVRFADTDALGHLNNVSYAAYAETARLEFFRSVGGLVTSLILASLGIEFRRQVRFGQAVHVDTLVERLGRSSITLAQTMYADGEPAAEFRSVVVYFDYATNRSKALEADTRARLEEYQRPATSDEHRATSDEGGSGGDRGAGVTW